MYLKRKVDVFLEAWKADQNRKPLIIKGSLKSEKRNQFCILQMIIMRVWLKLILFVMKNTRESLWMAMRLPT